MQKIKVVVMLFLLFVCLLVCLMFSFVSASNLSSSGSSRVSHFTDKEQKKKIGWRRV